MSKKSNGTEHPAVESADKDSAEKVVHFPTLAERDRRRKQEQENVSADPKPGVPFFNLAKLPPFTRFTTATFFIVHITLFVLMDPAERLQAFYAMGFVPGYFTHVLGGFPWFAPLGIVTHLLIHGGWMHLLFNSVMMLAMGTMFERLFGTRTTALFFLLCGFAGAAAYFAFNPFSTVPVIGASGSISGLFGAAIILLYQQGQLGKIGKRGPWPLVLFWVALMIGTGLIGGGDLAWQAHVGGFLAGIGLLQLLQKGKIRL
jgi:membrane associated rhomboid family serine protease